jgi:hypothetical protein
VLTFDVTRADTHALHWLVNPINRQDLSIGSSAESLVPFTSYFPLEVFSVLAPWLLIAFEAVAALGAVVSR